MKLATMNDGTPDGCLVVVAKHLHRVIPAQPIARTMQEALDNWDAVVQPLQALYEQLNAGLVAQATPYEQARFMAPLPRAWQWLDGSAFPQHGKLMAQAFHHAPLENEFPLMYQGLSHLFHGPHDEIPFTSEADGIDCEGEFGVLTGPVAKGTHASDAAALIRLVVQINDWSLRRYAPIEMKTGFGWILAKPACSVAPLAVTPDELGKSWHQHRVIATLEVKRNGKVIGMVPANEMEYGFEELIAHAARTRSLCAGSIIGSGTVSHSDYRRVGSCCISEQRAIEMIDTGAPITPFLKLGDRVSMRAYADPDELPLFGVMDQPIVAG